MNRQTLRRKTGYAPKRLCGHLRVPDVHTKISKRPGDNVPRPLLLALEPDVFHLLLKKKV